MILYKPAFKTSITKQKILVANSDQVHGYFIKKKHNLMKEKRLEYLKKNVFLIYIDSANLRQNCIFFFFSVPMSYDLKIF